MSSLPPVAVVDDDPMVVAAIADYLASLGLEVSTFPSADAFLESGQRFGCVITDLYMPGRSGVELIREIHRRQDATPVIVFSAVQGSRLRQEALEAGARVFVAKPVTGAALKGHLEDILGPFG